LHWTIAQQMLLCSKCSATNREASSNCRQPLATNGWLVASIAVGQFLSGVQQLFRAVKSHSHNSSIIDANIAFYSEIGTPTLEWYRIEEHKPEA
jgi:hypothetical protein